MSANAAPPERRDSTRATARSASWTSSSHSTTATGSPAPSSLHSFFSYSFGLWPITALAAPRMLPVER